MQRLGRLLLAVWAVPWALFWTAFHGSAYVLGSPFDRSGWWMDLVQRSYARSMLLAVFARLRVKGEADPSLLSGACFIMANHRSYLDISAATLALRPLSIRFVFKRELTRVPFLGWALATSHHIKVDRGNREQAVTAMRKAASLVKGRGIAITVFPEGTRSPDDRLLPFKKGGFLIAVDSGYPILPVSIHNSGRLLGKLNLLPRAGVITVTLHEPIPTRGLSREDIPDLMRRTRAAILSALPESRDLEAPSPTPSGSVNERGAR